MRIIILSILTLVMFACQNAGDHGHDHTGHDGHAEEAHDMSTTDTTIWTDQIELFVEYPVLTAGHTSRFAAHFTVLDGHQPVRQGSVTVSLIKGNEGIRHTVEAPSSPGIFTPALQPEEAGVYQLVFELQTPSFEETIVINNAQVFDSQELAKKSTMHESNAEATTFLKEQAWKMEFQTVPVEEKEIYSIIPTSGVWQVAPADYRKITATASGIVTFGFKNLTEGMRVKKGQVLMRISSDDLASQNLSAEVKKARAMLEQTQSAFERKKKLYESKIIAKSEYEKAKQDYEVARANYEALEKGYATGGKQLAAPFDGYLQSVAIDNGSFVEQGSVLATIASRTSSILKAEVSTTYALELQNIHNIMYQPASGIWSNLNETGGSVLSVGKEVSPGNPMLAIYARINEPVAWPRGSFSEVQVAYGNSHKSLVIPANALLEDYGQYSVIVQRSGESYERRPVELGERNGNEVAITKGLTLGEMVVTKGTYQVKMASMSGDAPAHGHAH